MTDTFSGLSGGEPPARALTRAQRAFLASPPGKAWLHPRFWAAFVILGDGGAAQSAPAGGGVSVEVLTTGGGEVLGLRRTDKGVAMRLMADRNAAGRHVSSTRLAQWRGDNDTVGAMRPLMDLGAVLAAGGYRTTGGLTVPVLELFDKATGAAQSPWVGAVRPGLSGFVTAAAEMEPGRWVFAVKQLNLKTIDGPGPVIQLFVVGADAAPRLLAEIEPPAGVNVDDVALARLGDAVLVTYGARAPALSAPAPVMDDYDLVLCTPPPVTWLDLRDLRSGARRAIAQASGWSVSAALAHDGQVVLGGAFKSSCGAEMRAAAGQVGPDLMIRTLYADPALGESRVEALSPLRAGGLLIAGTKRNIYDMRIPQPAPDSVGYGLGEMPVSISGMVLSLARDGRVSVPRMLESGSYIFVSAAEASDPKDVLVGGAIGDQAALFHLSAAP